MCDGSCLFDVRQYPEEILGFAAQGVRLPLTYKKSWDDGFGARGWKLNATIGDLEIIASTRETGKKINTSVLVHDILDHFLSGFGVSGHRSEAMALAQLALRTGSDPTPDYEQMINEDIMRGRVNKESLTQFLPDDLLALLPAATAMVENDIMAWLKAVIGESRLCARLLEHFAELGESGKIHAAQSWSRLGLNKGKQQAFGLALQKLLEQADSRVEQMDCDKVTAEIILNNNACRFALQTNNHESPSLVFQTNIT